MWLVEEMTPTLLHEEIGDRIGNLGPEHCALYVEFGRRAEEALTPYSFLKGAVCDPAIIKNLDGVIFLGKVLVGHVD